MALKAVIMAGGSGSRLWPLSTSSSPKQFLSVAGDNSMLQDTFKRIESLDIQSSVTVCNEEHRFLVAEQLNAIDKLGSIILEPVGKNTAPAIGLAALLSDTDEETLLLILPADHVIQDEVAFNKTVMSAIPIAESGKLVTFGIIPNEPNTGYGYIKKGKPQDIGFSVNLFAEKPSFESAEKYLKSGDYFWNSGMFLFKASRYLEELEKFRPDIINVCMSSIRGIDIESDFIRINEKIFNRCPSESIDYAVMENTDDAIVVPMDVGWNDIGSWASLWDISKKDKDGNVIHGDIIIHKSSNSYIRTDGKPIAAIGVDNLVIISTEDILVVAHKDNAQDVKIAAERYKQKTII